MFDVFGELQKFLKFDRCKIDNKVLTCLTLECHLKYHKWYQWVAFFLFLQCMLFYLPRYFWKASENGKVSMLVGNLQDPMLDAGGKQSQINEIVKYIRMHR